MLMTHWLTAFGRQRRDRSAATQFRQQPGSNGALQSGRLRASLASPLPKALRGNRCRTMRRDDIGKHALLQIEVLETRVLLSGSDPTASLVAEASAHWATSSGSTERSWSGSKTVGADDLIAVDTSQTYELTGSAIAGEDGLFDANRTQYLGIESFDAQQRPIRPVNSMRNGQSALTTLASPLAASDTQIELVDATGWEGQDGQPVDWKGTNLAWWPAGSVDPIYVYSQDVASGSASDPLWGTDRSNKVNASPSEQACLANSYTVSL